MKEILFKKILKNINIKIIIFFMVIILFIIISAWNFLIASNIRSFSKDSKAKFESLKNWEQSIEESDNLESTKNRVEKINNDSHKLADEIISKQVPKKSENLKRYLVDYYDLNYKISLETIRMIDWSSSVNKTLKYSADLENIDTTSTETIVVSLEAIQKNTKNSLAELKEIKAPDSVRKFHNSFIISLEKVDGVYQKIIDAVKANNLDVLAEISGELSEIEINQKDIPQPWKIIEDEYQSDLIKLNSLEIMIEDEITKTKGTYFAF
jgi:hypothetical protein